jgi:hypothetical protein
MLQRCGVALGEGQPRHHNQPTAAHAPTAVPPVTPNPALQMRNAVLGPMFASPHYEHGFPADRVVYINDVWFCAQDVWRLAQYR